jgi:uncharacterized protein (TIGR00297 family)
VPIATIESAVLTFSLCLALSSLAYYKQVLTKGGTVAAFVIGMIIGIAGDVTWLFLLLFFLLSSFAATKYRFALKEAMGVQEGKKGERGAMNVLANGFAPTAVALLSTLNLGFVPVTWAGLAFLSALAVAGADTLASEIGVLSDKARLITTFKRVKAGTDGGISVLGEVCAIGASLYTALFGWLILYFLSSRVGLTVTLPPESWFLLIPAVVGFLGCQIDSVLGATVERRGWIHKKGVNLVATSTGALIAYLLLLWFA